MSGMNNPPTPRKNNEDLYRHKGSYKRDPRSGDKCGELTLRFAKTLGRKATVLEITKPETTSKAKA
jgi:hypothetical protein